MIDLDKIGQGSNTNRGGRAPQNNDRPAAKLWLNVGYWAGEGEDRRFVSLPTGIPLDTQEPVKATSSNQGFAAFQQARNALLKALINAGMAFEPGQEDMVQLEVQIRRVNDAEQAPITDNVYALPTGAGLLTGTAG